MKEAEQLKKEAQELRDKFYEPVPRRVMHYELHCQLAKDCAVICVQDRMKDAEKNWTSDDKNYEHSAHYKHNLALIEAIKNL